jgi:hypothetical protein
MDNESKRQNQITANEMQFTPFPNYEKHMTEFKMPELQDL